MASKSKEYRGRLSAGCERCRARRVKCDQTKPVCVRCMKIGAHSQCTYRNLLEMTFRDESVDVAKRVKQVQRREDMLATRGSRSSLRNGYFNGDDSSGPVSRAATPVSGPSLWSLQNDLLELAVQRFFYDFTVSVPERLQSGVYSYLPQFWIQSQPGSSLREAVTTAALANLDRRSGFRMSDPYLVIQKHYGNTLQAIQRDVNDPRYARSNELMAAVLVLSNFELMSSGGNNPALAEAHAQGLAALLMSRNVPVPDDGDEWRIYQSANVQLLAICLTRRVPACIPYTFIKSMYEQPIPFPRLAGLMHRAVDLLALRPSPSPERSSRRPTGITSLSEQLLDLEEDLSRWRLTLPDFALFTIAWIDPVSIPSWLRPLLRYSGGPELVHRYDSILMAYMWGHYRMTRMMMAVALLKSSSPNKSRHIETVLETADEIAASTLAVFLTPIDGKPQADTMDRVCGFRTLVLLGPLMTALKCLEALPPEKEVHQRRGWIGKALGFIMRSFHASRPRSAS